MRSVKLTVCLANVFACLCAGAEIPVRDPSVVAFPDEGICRLYSAETAKGAKGVCVRTSANLSDWSAPKRILDLSTDVGRDATDCVTPRLCAWRGAYYLFVALTRKGDPRSIWAFRGETPEGPFRPVSDRAVTPPGMQALEGSLWVEDGRPFLLFSQEWSQTGEGRILLAPLSDDLSQLTGEPRTLVRATDFSGVNVSDLKRKDVFERIADAPFLYRSSRGGKLYLLWSNTLFDYGRAVIVSESASGRAEGPWRRHRLLFDRGNGGHGSVASAPDGRLFLAFARTDGKSGERLGLLPLADDGEALRLAPSEQRYAPVPGGFEITDGQAEFSRPLYGSHAADNPRKPRKNYFLTGDRPRVRLSRYAVTFRPRDVADDGTLEFGRGLSGVTFRYAEGRAEYAFANGASVTLVRSTLTDGLLAEVSGEVPHEMSGAWRLRASATRDGRSYLQFGREDEQPLDDPAGAFDAAKERLKALASVVRVKTPDPLLDSAVACLNVAADALFEDCYVTHGASAWHIVWCGWRGIYVPVTLGRTADFKRNAKGYFAAQQKDGRIPCDPWGGGGYNMCEVFVDSLMLYWDATGDVGFFRDEGGYAAVKRHLGWLETNMKVPFANLYENFLNAWNTDNKWCNGGAGTIATAYAYRAYATMARIAAKIGETSDAAAFAAKAAAIRADAERLLFDEAQGTWGEFRERFGEGRLIACPDTSSVYTPIDMGLSSPDRSRASLLWAERNIPSVFADGAAFLRSSNKLPLFFGTCGIYPQETVNFAHAWFLVGESELGWRHFRDAIGAMARGVEAGPGVISMQTDENLRNFTHRDFGDPIGVILRATTEGLFGIHLAAGEGRATVEPGFPAAWDHAEIDTPYLSYRWTRAGGVEVTKNPMNLTVTVRQPKPTLVGNAQPKPHLSWGAPKGEGTKPVAGRSDPVALDALFNCNLRTLHTGKFGFSPLDYFPWNRFGRRAVFPDGRSIWEQIYAISDWSSDRHRHHVPERLDWPADGVVRTASGVGFRLGPAEGANGAFCGRCEGLPDVLTVPLAGRAKGVAFLLALSTNPNLDWAEALRATVTYADGGRETLALVPPDNCDDWINYSQREPYHLTGEHVMLGNWAHANVLTISVDPSRELKALELRCLSCETLGGLLAVTAVR